jgi:hypothetical protein
MPPQAGNAMQRHPTAILPYAVAPVIVREASGGFWQQHFPYPTHPKNRLDHRFTSNINNLLLYPDTEHDSARKRR